MAKATVETTVNSIKDILGTLEVPPPVYDATDYTGKPFVVTNVEMTVFEPSERNGGRTGERTDMTCYDPITKEVFIVQTSQKGVTIPVWALVDNGYLPFAMKLAKKGKFLTVVPA